MSVLGFNNYFEKQPSETLSIKTEWDEVAEALASNNYAIGNCELVVFDGAGGNKTSDLVSGVPTIDANNHLVYATFRAGLDGQDYNARFKTTWSLNGQPDQTLERDLKIEVRQKGY